MKSKFIAISIISVLLLKCSGVLAQQSAPYQKVDCCFLKENLYPFDFSSLKSSISLDNKNLIDIVAIERISGRPDRDFIIHLFKTSVGKVFLEKKEGNKKIKTTLVKDNSILKLIDSLPRKNLEQICFNYNGTLYVKNLFEVRIDSKTTFSYSLDSQGLEHVCEGDKAKLVVAYNIFEKLVKMAK